MTPTILKQSSLSKNPSGIHPFQMTCKLMNVYAKGGSADKSGVVFLESCEKDQRKRGPKVTTTFSINFTYLSTNQRKEPLPEDIKLKKHSFYNFYTVERFFRNFSFPKISLKSILSFKTNDIAVLDFFFLFLLLKNRNFISVICQQKSQIILLLIFCHTSAANHKLHLQVI